MESPRLSWCISRVYILLHSLTLSTLHNICTEFWYFYTEYYLLITENIPLGNSLSFLLKRSTWVMHSTRLHFSPQMDFLLPITHFYSPSKSQEQQILQVSILFLNSKYNFWLPKQVILSICFIVLIWIKDNEQ